MRLPSLLLAVGILAGAFFVGGSSAVAPAPCPGFRDVPFQGPSCPIEGGFAVQLRDGSFVVTHGPDPAAPVDTVGSLGGYVSANPVQSVCVDPASTRERGVLVYAVAPDLANRYASVAPTLRSMMQDVNGLLVRDSTEAGRRVDYRMRCTSGVLDVAQVTLPTTSGAATFSTITSDLKAAGFDKTYEKYWVYYDDHGLQNRCGCGGQGNLLYDTQLGARNANNVGPSYGIDYGDLGVGSWGEMTLMHEDGHNLGAVQLNAPHSTGAGHCTDGLDIMCYNDGGAFGYRYAESRCTDRRRYDCGTDDYFNVAPAPGSYLARFWNLGSTSDWWIQGCDRLEGALTLGGASVQRIDGTNSVTVSVPSSCAGHPFSLETRAARPVQQGPLNPGITVTDYNVCWLAGSATLTCHATPADEFGTVPAGADGARIDLVRGETSPFVLSVV